MTKTYSFVLFFLLVMHACRAAELQDKIEPKVGSELKLSPARFNFLMTKYPHLVTSAHEPFKRVEGEDGQDEYQSSGFSKEQFIATGKEVLWSPVFDPMLLKVNVGIGDVELYKSLRMKDLLPLLRHVPDGGFFKVYKERKITPQNILELNIQLKNGHLSGTQLVKQVGLIPKILRHLLLRPAKNILQHIGLDNT
jgi:hypothetical protein